MKLVGDDEMRRVGKKARMESDATLARGAEEVGNFVIIKVGLIKKLRKTVNTLSYKTVAANAATVDKQWVLVDANDQVLGRLASKVAKILRGKHKPNYTPNVDCGDNVVIINASKVKLTGNKMDARLLFNYSGYPGGRHDKTPRQMMTESPERLLERTIKGMLPKNRLGAKILKNLYVYAGAEHEQEAQQPKVLDINAMK